MSPLPAQHPRKGGGSRYGQAAAKSIAQRVDASGGKRKALVAASLELARLAAGGEIPWDYAEELVSTLGDICERDPGEVDRFWRYARRKGEAEPKRAPTSGSAVRSGGEVVLRLVAWWEQVNADRVLVDDRRGATAKKVLCAFLLLGLQTRKVRVQQSTRRLAEAAGVDRKTMQRNRDLWSRHIREHIGGSSFTGRSTEWQFVFRQDARALVIEGDGERRSAPMPEAKGTGRSRYGGETSPALVEVFPGTLPLSDPACNVWHRRASAWLTWCALDNQNPEPLHSLAEAVGRHPDTVRRILNRLEDDGLAKNIETGWIRIDGPEPASFDYSAKRRERHEAERALWKRHREARRSAPIPEEGNEKG